MARSTARTRERLRTVEATFSPTRVEDLRPEGWDAIGWRGTWQALWNVDDPDSPYHGQTVWMPLLAESWIGLVPDEDLLDIQPR